MCLLIEIRHNIIYRVMGIILRGENFYYMLEIDCEITHKNQWVYWGVNFEGLGVH